MPPPLPGPPTPLPELNSNNGHSKKFFSIPRLSLRTAKTEGIAGEEDGEDEESIRRKTQIDNETSTLFSYPESFVAESITHSELDCILAANESQVSRELGCPTDGVHFRSEESILASLIRNQPTDPHRLTKDHGHRSLRAAPLTDHEENGINGVQFSKHGDNHFDSDSLEEEGRYSEPLLDKQSSKERTRRIKRKEKLGEGFKESNFGTTVATDHALDQNQCSKVSLPTTVLSDSWPTERKQKRWSVTETSKTGLVAQRASVWEKHFKPTTRSTSPVKLSSKGTKVPSVSISEPYPITPNTTCCTTQSPLGTNSDQSYGTDMAGSSITWSGDRRQKSRTWTSQKPGNSCPPTNGQNPNSETLSISVSTSSESSRTNSSLSFLEGYVTIPLEDLVQAYIRCYSSNSRDFTTSDYLQSRQTNRKNFSTSELVDKTSEVSGSTLTTNDREANMDEVTGRKTDDQQNSIATVTRSVYEPLNRMELSTMSTPVTGTMQFEENSQRQGVHRAHSLSSARLERRPLLMTTSRHCIRAPKSKSSNRLARSPVIFDTRAISSPTNQKGLTRGQEFPIRRTINGPNLSDLDRNRLLYQSATIKSAEYPGWEEVDSFVDESTELKATIHKPTANVSVLTDTNIEKALLCTAHTPKETRNTHDEVIKENFRNCLDRERRTSCKQCSQIGVLTGQSVTKNRPTYCQEKISTLYNSKPLVKTVPSDPLIAQPLSARNMFKPDPRQHFSSNQQFAREVHNPANQISSLSPAAQRYEQHVQAAMAERQRPINEGIIWPFRPPRVLEPSVPARHTLHEEPSALKKADHFRIHNPDQDSFCNGDTVEPDEWRHKLGLITRWRHEVNNAMQAGETDMEGILRSPEPSPSVTQPSAEWTPFSPRTRGPNQDMFLPPPPNDFDNFPQYHSSFEQTPVNLSQPSNIRSELLSSARFKDFGLSAKYFMNSGGIQRIPESHTIQKTSTLTGAPHSQTKYTSVTSVKSLLDFQPVTAISTRNPDVGSTYEQHPYVSFTSFTVSPLTQGHAVQSTSRQPAMLSNQTTTPQLSNRYDAMGRSFVHPPNPAELSVTHPSAFNSLGPIVCEARINQQQRTDTKQLRENSAPVPFGWYPKPDPENYRYSPASPQFNPVTPIAPVMTGSCPPDALNQTNTWLANMNPSPMRPVSGEYEMPQPVLEPDGPRQEPFHSHGGHVSVNPVAKDGQDMHDSFITPMPMLRGVLSPSNDLQVVPNRPQQSSIYPTVSRELTVVHSRPQMKFRLPNSSYGAYEGLEDFDRMVELNGLRQSQPVLSPAKRVTSSTTITPITKSSPQMTEVGKGRQKSVTRFQLNMPGQSEQNSGIFQRNGQLDDHSQTNVETKPRSHLRRAATISPVRHIRDRNVHDLPRPAPLKGGQLAMSSGFASAGSIVVPAEDTHEAPVRKPGLPTAAIRNGIREHGLPPPVDVYAYPLVSDFQKGLEVLNQVNDIGEDGRPIHCRDGRLQTLAPNKFLLGRVASNEDLCIQTETPFAFTIAATDKEICITKVASADDLKVLANGHDNRKNVATANLPRSPRPSRPPIPVNLRLTFGSESNITDHRNSAAPPIQAPGTNYRVMYHVDLPFGSKAAADLRRNPARLRRLNYQNPARYSMPCITYHEDQFKPIELNIPMSALK
ncbi:unnamed protein product [Calicophoron daubneyi]|uniref:Uncharacterized protein n=1 Tax=Calicophoron daubneyi TaxID=300641 RepID=A0AAV2TW98_CALDB